MKAVIIVNPMLQIRIPKGKESWKAKLMDAPQPLDKFTIANFRCTDVYIKLSTT
jgi:hypothetical protein